MSNPSEIVALSLEQILSSMADSLAEAQAALNEVDPYDQFGRPNVMYSLPYLDFKLQVTSEFESRQIQETDSTNQRRVGPVNTDSLQARRLQAPVELIKFKPVSISGSNTSSTEIISTISGRFVANVPNEGLPQIIMDLSTKKLAEYGNIVSYRLEVIVSNAANEMLSGALVELNFDEEMSLFLNNGETVIAPGLDIGEGRTDGNGKVVFTINLPKNPYEDGRTFAYVANTGTISQAFTLRKS